MTGARRTLRAERIRMLLALEALPEARRPTGSPPDVEDLAALLDGRLGAGRRAEVISHLVHDDALYEDWLLLGEHLDLLR